MHFYNYFNIFLIFNRINDINFKYHQNNPLYLNKSF